MPHLGEEHARDREHRYAAVLELRLAVLDHLGRRRALGEAEGVEVEARARDARDLVAREAVGELGGGRVLQRRDVELGGGLRRGRRDERRGAAEGEGGDDLLPANRRGAVSAGLVQRSYPLVRRALSTRGRSSRALRKRARLARVSLHSFGARSRPASTRASQRQLRDHRCLAARRNQAMGSRYPEKLSPQPPCRRTKQAALASRQATAAR
mmetsp:Transcript_5573/g.16898  ORF Transcript_5573/g.16898 Transcript_5573/m.16898 type:complete len:211 (-) Transcript_5573:58-690(-)